MWKACVLLLQRWGVWVKEIQAILDVSWKSFVAILAPPPKKKKMHKKPKKIKGLQATPKATQKLQLECLFVSFVLDFWTSVFYTRSIPWMHSNQQIAFHIRIPSNTPLPPSCCQELEGSLHCPKGLQEGVPPPHPKKNSLNQPGREGGRGYPGGSNWFPGNAAAASLRPWNTPRKHSSCLNCQLKACTIFGPRCLQFSNFGPPVSLFLLSLFQRSSAEPGEAAFLKDVPSEILVLQGPCIQETFPRGPRRGSKNRSRKRHGQSTCGGLCFDSLRALLANFGNTLLLPCRLLGQEGHKGTRREAQQQLKTVQERL